MFTNEDFDVDEDFLNDISQKESQYYSQPLSSDEECTTKRFKNNKDSYKPSYSESISNYKEPIYAKSKKDCLAQNTNEIGGRKTVRTNLILERLNRNETTTSGPSIDQHADKIESQSLTLAKSSSTQESFSHSTNNECRKNLILEKLRRNKKSASACPQNPEAKFCPSNLNSVNPNNSKLEPRETITKSPIKSMTTCNKPVTLVRQFPGPAGLLPHISGGIIPPPIPESSCFDDSNNGFDTDAMDNTSMISKYYSQNTTNLFSEGAWQLFVSDLSPDFLNGHEISAVKQKVLTNSYGNNKVPFLAGIVQRVDLSCLDPLVVLKDCTGSIEGTICKDILVEYPHFLDIGVVLFLGNVGFLTIGSYLKKCHVIITLKNIINVYTCKSRIFSISDMNARLQNFNNCSSRCESVVNRVLNSSGSSNSKFECGSTMGRVRATENTNTQLCLSNFEDSDNVDNNKHINSEVSKTSTDKSTNLLKNDDENLNNSHRNTNSPQYIRHINIQSTSESGDLQDCDDDFAASFLDIDDDNLFSEAATDIKAIKNNEASKHASVLMNENTVVFQKNTVLNATHLNLKLPPETKHFISKASEVSNGNTEIPDVIGRTQVTTTSATTEKSNLTRASNIKLKLSVFRSNTELTPQPCEDLGIVSTIEVHKQNESSFTSDMLFNGENDSDEELFSQIDVESIVSNHNRPNNVN